MSSTTSDEDQDHDSSSVFQFSFQFYMPVGGGEGGEVGEESNEGGDATNDRPRVVQVLRFNAGFPAEMESSSSSSPSNINNFTSLGLMRTSSGEGQGGQLRRGLRPLPSRQRQQQEQQAQDFMSYFQQNASVFAAIAIRQFLMDGGFPDTPHLQGQPPASKTAVEALQIIDTLSEKRRIKHRICSICQDEFKSCPSTALCSSVLPAANVNTATATDTATATNSATEAIYTSPQDDCNAIIRMPCHHIFHKDCLTPWLMGSSATCPTCRYEIATENEDYNRGLRERMKERDDKLKLDPDTDMEDEQDVLRSTDVTPISALPPSSSKDVTSPLLSSISTAPADRLFEDSVSSATLVRSPSYRLRSRKRQRRTDGVPDNTSSVVPATSSIAPATSSVTPSAVEGGLRRSKRLRRNV